MMRSKNFKMEESKLDITKRLEPEGIMPFLESQLLMRNSLPDEQLEIRLKKASKLGLELKM